jgi:2-dehydropantoate 2-reductase
MLQHMEEGRQTEIDSLNGAVVREGRALDIPTPYNEALTLLVKGREAVIRQSLHGEPLDYDRLEREAKAG